MDGEIIYKSLDAELRARGMKLFRPYTDSALWIKPLITWTRFFREFFKKTDYIIGKIPKWQIDDGNKKIEIYLHMKFHTETIGEICKTLEKKFRIKTAIIVGGNCGFYGGWG